MTPTEYLLARHEGGSVLLDSNLLLLLVVGDFSRALIPDFKRLNKYSPGDYDDLLSVSRRFRKIATTPNILTEVSNLSEKLRDPLKGDYFRAFAQNVALFQEDYIPSADIGKTPVFIKLGLTDAGIARIAKSRMMLVLTDDLTLYQYLIGLGVDALNFNHVRSWQET